jgi:SAM-dependent methyltransferase
LQLQPVLKPEWESYESGEFASRITAELGTNPDFAKLSEIRRYLRGNSLLEIGPGTGHLLAAAAAEGFRVTGVELSSANRKFIRDSWGIDTVSTRLEANQLPEESQDNVVSFNCLEHITDIRAHVLAVARVLAPGGRFFVSTCNANALAARIVGRWWSMYGTEDHVCIPTATGLRRLGASVGLRPLRIWSSEYPLETPAGLVVALRSWMHERITSETRNSAPESASSNPSAHSLARRMIKSKLFAPVGNSISAFGLGGTVKVVYCKP